MTTAGQSPQHERRRHPRGAVPISVQLSAGQAFDIITQTVNVSVSGAYCEVERFLPVMTKLQIILVIPNSKTSSDSDTSEPQTISCSGVVVRAEPELPTQPHDGDGRYRIAIFFTDLPEDDEQLLADYIDGMLSEEPVSS